MADLSYYRSMLTQISRLKRFLLPRSFFGRLTLILIIISVALICLSSLLFYEQAYQMLDKEADSRLLEEAYYFANQLKSFSSKEEEKEKEAKHWLAASSALTDSRGTRLFASLDEAIHVKQASGWIQNLYWVNLESKKPMFHFLSSLSKTRESPLLPPTIEDVEDMIDEGLAFLEDGRPFFPNPFTLSGTRRYKIILYPILDSDGILQSIFGLEADLEYLNLNISIKTLLTRLIFFGAIASIIASMLLARSFSRRINVLLQDLQSVANHQQPEQTQLGIWELDILKNGLTELGEHIETQNKEIHAVFEQKLSELAFTGGAIAHEIRNPLAAIELHLGLIKRKFSQSNNDFESFQEIENQLISMKTLIEQFLKYSHKVSPQLSEISLLPLISELVDLKKRTFHDFQVHVTIPEGFSLKADPNMLRQIFENLLNNALEAKSEGLVIKIDATKKDENRFRICISDNGPGVPIDLVPRLFTPFASGRPSGHGIGLALVRKLVEAHNGRITCQLVSGGGTKFCLELLNLA